MLPFVLPVAIAALVAVVAWGVGGYEPWATFALEAGALAVAGSLFLLVLFRTSREDRARNAAIHRSQKRGSTDVEFLEPSSRETPGGPFRDPVYWMGYPFRRSGAGLLVLLATIWTALSLVPLPAALLSVLSPKAFALRAEALALVGEELTSAPWSVVPFLTFQDLLLWLAYVMIFFAAYHAVDSTRALKRLTISLVALGAASGAYGVFQWLVALGAGADGAFLQATGSFGNRNHYAFFQEMLLLVGLGWLQMRWRDAPQRAPDRASAQEARAKLALVGIGIAVIALSLLFSLSRSGITFAVAGGAFFLYLTRARGRAALAFATGLVAVALWIGIDPIVGRFETVPDEISGEAGRTTVWRDSVPALRDFWLTGSGLSSFQHVYPIYRSFGGRRFYSWAHNDYLQIGIELGVPGLVLALALIGWAVRCAHRVRRSLVERGSSLTVLHAGYCSAAIAVALHSFTDFGLHLPANAALLAVVLAVATGMGPERRSRSAPDRGAEEPGRKLRRSPPTI